MVDVNMVKELIPDKVKSDTLGVKQGHVKIYMCSVTYVLNNCYRHREMNCNFSQHLPKVENMQ